MTKKKPGVKYNAPTRTRQESDLRHPFTKEELRAMLPRVGERRMEKMTASTACLVTSPTPLPCVVVEVNTEGLWYRVQFEQTGICQCYKVPELNWAGPRGGLLV